MTLDDIENAERVAGRAFRAARHFATHEDDAYLSKAEYILAEARHFAQCMSWLDPGSKQWQEAVDRLIGACSPNPL